MNKATYETQKERISRENAEAEIQHLERATALPSRKEIPPSTSWKKLLYRTTKKNAVKRNIEWDLSLDHFLSLIDQSGMKCTVTGIPFETGASDYPGRRPFFPSLDRKDSASGYSFENCRIVCVAANLAMNQWGEDVLKKLAIGFFLHQDLGRGIQRGMISEILPDNVLVYRGKKGVTYKARIRNINNTGKDISLGTFKTPSEAAAAQAKWIEENGPTIPELSSKNQMGRK